VDVGLTEFEAGENCAFFRLQRDYEAGMLRRANYVLFALSVAVAASLACLVAGIAVGQAAAGVGGAVGSVMSGGAAVFLLNERKDHQDRVDKWVAAIEAAGCADGPA
jgi:hypothetical protein